MEKETYKKRIYHERKSKGICVECGKNKAIGKVLCEKCSEKRSQYVRGMAAFYRSLGICPNCHKERIYGDEYFCFECREKKRKQYEKDYARMKKNPSPKRKEKQKVYRKNHYEKCKQNGICPRCGRKTAYGYVRCPICREKNRIYKMLKRSEEQGSDDEGI